MQLPINYIWHYLLHVVCINFLTLVLYYTELCGDRNSPLDIPDNTVRTYTLQGATRGRVYTVSIQAYVNTTSDSVQSEWVDFNEVEPGSLLCAGCTVFYMSTLSQSYFNHS